MDVDLPEDQSVKNVMKMLSKSKDAATSLHKIKHKISKRSSESTSTQRSHKNSTKKTSNEKSDPKITSKDQKKHSMVLQDKKLPDGLELSYISKGKKLLTGYTKGRGIFCDHCNEVVSATMFEAHAGKSNSKKPYQHIFLEDGMSLHQYASILKLNCQRKVENNDLLCMVCQKSGNLVFCDGCPRSFHKECISDTFITPKKRFCKPCQLSMKCLVLKAKAVNDGTVSGPKVNAVKDGTVYGPKVNAVKDGSVSGPKVNAVNDETVSGLKVKAVKDVTVSKRKASFVNDGTVSGPKAKAVKDGPVSGPKVNAENDGTVCGPKANAVKDGTVSQPKANAVKDGTVSGPKVDAVKDGTVSRRKAKAVKDGTVSKWKAKAVNDGTVSGPKANAVKDGTVSGPKVNAVNDGTVSGPKVDAVNDGTVSGPKVDAVNDGKVSGPKADAVKDKTVSGPKAYAVNDGTVSKRKANAVNDGTVSKRKAIAVNDGTVSKRKAIAVNDGTVSGPKAKAVKDGTVSGAEPTEQTAKHGIEIDDPFEQIACVLCRSCDFSTDGFNDQTSIVCDQCEKEYHIGCLKKDMDVDLKELPTGYWFCTWDCESLHSLIKFLVKSGPLMAKDYYMQIVKNMLKDSDVDNIKHADMRWIVFTGKDACEEHQLLLPQAIEILHDCFDPIIDSVTGEDFIPAMAYGRQMGSSNFSGVYNALLTVNLKVVTAGMFCVFGREFAELPIVATSQPNQGKGYFQAFLVCFERLLSQIRVKKIVIPAASDAKAMWIKKFGFTKVPSRKLAKYRQTQTSMVAFQGTTLLQRAVPQGIVTSLRRRVTC